MRLGSEIFARGILAGAVVNILQLTEGPGNIFLWFWDTLSKSTAKAPEWVKSYQKLRYCHWCLSPYIAFLLWLPDHLGGFWGLLYMIGIGSVTASATRKN